MNDPSQKKYPNRQSVVFFLTAAFLFFSSNILAAEDLSPTQKEARAYRAEGMKYQNSGDLSTASDFYQRAITVDPFYAVAYNDLGVISEAQGDPGKAKEFYLKAIEIEPDFGSPYTNLAIIYEQERNLDKAAYYWKKRADFGPADDPWAAKAKRRYEDISAVLTAVAPPPPQPLLQDPREREVINLSRQVQVDKSLLTCGEKMKGSKMLAKRNFAKAQMLYKQGKDLAALTAAIDANQLDPSNTEIEDFINKITTRMLSR